MSVQACYTCTVMGVKCHQKLLMGLTICITGASWIMSVNFYLNFKLTYGCTLVRIFAFCAGPPIAILNLSFELYCRALNFLNRNMK